MAVGGIAYCSAAAAIIVSIGIRAGLADGGVERISRSTQFMIWRSYASRTPVTDMTKMIAPATQPAAR